MRSVRGANLSPRSLLNRWDTICFLQEMLDVLRHIAQAEQATMIVFLIDQAILDIRELVAGEPRRSKSLASVLEAAPQEQET